MKNAEKTNKKAQKRKPVKLAIILFFVTALIGGLAFAGYKAYEYYQDATFLVKSAEELKAELKSLATHVQKGNYEAANISVQKVDTLSAQIRATLNDERWQFVQEKAPEQYSEDLKTAVKFLDVVDEASNTLLKPGIKYLREKGLPSKSTFTKISPELGNKLNEYADLIDEFCPAIEKVLNDFNALPEFKMEKLESKVKKYRTLARENDSEIRIYLKFAKETSDGFVRPVAKYLIENGSALKLDFSMDKIGPEMASQILIFADGIDTLTPLVEKTLKEFNALPAIKVESVEKKLSKYRKLAKDNEADIISLLKFSRELSTGVIRPAAAVMTRSPFSKLKVGKNDIDTKIIRDYLNLVETVKPYFNRIDDIFKTNKLLKDHQKQTAKITVKLDKAKELLAQYDAYVPYIDVILGDGSDKVYLLVAQNSAEMRSCGGFPGSIGTVSIKDGILHIGEFEGFEDQIPRWNKGINTFSKVETNLFSKNWYCDKLTAASVNPHFPRVAQIWAKGYKKKHKVNVDGVISMTPAIIGRLISITGPVTLSNKVKLDEKYSVKYLQRDIYFQYYKKYPDTKKRDKINALVDGLFAESVKTVISRLMSDLNIKTILKLVDVVKTSSEDRVFMMWMADSQAQETVKSLGCSGALNSDSSKPELGVFFNVKDANKLGMYVDISVKYGKEKANKDGSVTYPVTVKIKNNIDSTSLREGKGNSYLTSKNNNGSMSSVVYFFAPAGGKITSFKNNSSLTFKKTEYQKLSVYYNPTPFLIKPKKTVTFTFNVTTAPGVNEKPKIVTTPLLTSYRNAKAPK